MRFCRKMRSHFITNATANTAIAMSMAKEIWTAKGVRNDGIQDLVELINSASLKLIRVCENHAYDATAKATGAAADGGMGGEI